MFKWNTKDTDAAIAAAGAIAGLFVGQMPEVRGISKYAEPAAGAAILAGGVYLDGRVGVALVGVGVAMLADGILALFGKAV